MYAKRQRDLAAVVKVMLEDMPDYPYVFCISAVSQRAW